MARRSFLLSSSPGTPGGGRVGVRCRNRETPTPTLPRNTGGGRIHSAPTASEQRRADNCHRADRCRLRRGRLRRGAASAWVGPELHRHVVADAFAQVPIVVLSSQPLYH